MCHKFNEDAGIKKCNPIKRCVSLKKKRFENDLFDLDLAYITYKVIAMGYPSTGYESIYRNSRSDVISFMTSYHPTHYKIYNL
jgi:phosphatidylinositol-3,4,5-trisphosphate 3-phosphatase/dual-specificity protein phosphatase PTEN